MRHTHTRSQSLQNLVAISERSLLTLKAGYIGNNGKNWLLNPGTSRVVKVKDTVANGKFG